MKSKSLKEGPVDKAYREWQEKIKKGKFKPTKRELFNYAHAIGWKDACGFLRGNGK